MNPVRRCFLVVAALFVCFLPARTAVTGTVAGIVKDQTGAVITGAKLTATNTAQGLKNRTTSNPRGEYVFPSLPVGTYDLLVEAPGFKPQTRTGLVVDLDSSLKIDFTLELAERVEEVTIRETDIHVETASTQVGEIVSGKSMTTVAL